jgi:hypothetical protein
MVRPFRYRLLKQVPKWSSFWWPLVLLVLAWGPLFGVEALSRWHRKGPYDGDAVTWILAWGLNITPVFSALAVLLLICKFIRALRMALNEEGKYW